LPTEEVQLGQHEKNVGCKGVEENMCQYRNQNKHLAFIKFVVYKGGCVFFCVLMKLLVFILLVFGVFLSPLSVGTASAVNAGSVSAGDLMIVLCHAVLFINGPVGRTLAAFIIVGVGFGFFTAKVSWAVMIGVVLGLGAIFGAISIVNAITGDTGNPCSTTASTS